MIVTLAGMALSLLLTIMIVVLLLRFGSTYNFAERLGGGLMGAMIMLSSFKLGARLGGHLGHHLGSWVAPFDPWYQLVWRFGIALFIGGKLYRLERHRRGNVNQQRMAAEYYAQREDLP